MLTIINRFLKFQPRILCLELFLSNTIPGDFNKKVMDFISCTTFTPFTKIASKLAVIFWALKTESLEDFVYNVQNSLFNGFDKSFEYNVSLSEYPRTVKMLYTCMKLPNCRQPARSNGAYLFPFPCTTFQTSEIGKEVYQLTSYLPTEHAKVVHENE